MPVAHAPGMPGTFCPPPRVSDPDIHHGTCVKHVPWCMPGSLTSGFLWSRWRENVPCIPGACATRNVTYQVRGLWFDIHEYSQHKHCIQKLCVACCEMYCTDAFNPPGPRWKKKTVFSWIRIPIVKIRRSHDPLDYMIGTPILAKGIFTLRQSPGATVGLCVVHDAVYPYLYYTSSMKLYTTVTEHRS